MFTKPSISAHPSPLMRAGENVTLRCHSPLLDKFILHQENSTGHFQRRGEMFTGGHATADFVIGPMTLATVGTYRCYGSLSSSPYEWSAPSDPVDIVIGFSLSYLLPAPSTVLQNHQDCRVFTKRVAKRTSQVIMAKNHPSRCVPQ